MPRVLAFWLQPELTYDGAYYLRQAQRLSHFRYDLIGFPPGYPAAAWLLHFVTRDYVIAGRLVSLLAGCATVYVMYSWSRRHLSASLAFIATLFLALHPHVVIVNVETLSESLYVLATLAAVLLYEQRRDLAAGVLLGYAFLVRPEAFLILVSLILFRWFRERRFSWLCVGLVPVLIYAGLASHAVGQPVVTPKQAQWDLAGAGTQLRQVLVTLHGTYPLLLIPFAIATGIRRKPHLLFPLLYLLTLPWFDIHIQQRIHIPALPYLTVLGLAWIGTFPNKARLLLLSIAAALFLAGAAPGYRFLVAPEPLTPQAREIGTRLSPYLHFDDRVGGRFPLVAYYAGAGFARARRELGYPAVIDSLMADGATHLLVLESEIDHVLPQLRPFFHDAGAVAAESRLEGVAWIDAPVGARAILYRFRRPAIEIGNARLVTSNVSSVTWSGPNLVAATVAGDLVHVRTDDGQLRNLGARGVQPCASPDGGRVVFVRSGDAAVTELQVNGPGARSWSGTIGDRPAWPVYVGDQIVYVREAEPRGLRALDPASGRRRGIQIAGLDSSEAAPTFVSARGRDLAITLIPAQADHPRRRMVVRAIWPVEDSSTRIEVEGRRGTRLLLYDESTSWVEGQDCILASVLVRGNLAEGGTTSDNSSLSVLGETGLIRRIAFDFDRARQPRLQFDRVAFVSGEGDLRIAPVRTAELSVARPKVFALVEVGSRPENSP